MKVKWIIIILIRMRIKIIKLNYLNQFWWKKYNQEEVNIEENNNIKNGNSNETIININNEIH